MSLRQHDSLHQKKSRRITQTCIYYDSNHHASPETRYFTWWIASINSSSAPRWNHIKPLPPTHKYAKMTHHMRWWAAQQHHICQFKPQLVFMLMCFWKQGKCSCCTNSHLYHTEHFTSKCAMAFITTWSTCGNRLRKFSLSVTSSDMAPMDTGSKWTEQCL